MNLLYCKDKNKLIAHIKSWCLGTEDLYSRFIGVELYKNQLVHGIEKVLSLYKILQVV